MRIGLSALLLGAAALKLFGLGTSGVPQVGWFSQPWVQVLAAEWELVLGGWLITGFASRLSWLAALVTFLSFAGVSGYLGWVGVASCGCLGGVKTNPWWAFGVDVIAIGFLAVSRPAARAGTPSRFFRAAGVWAGSVALVCAVMIGVSGLVYGSVEVAIAKLRGETLAVTPYIDFGRGKPGDTLEATATATNYTAGPIRLIGGTTDCTCATVEDFPLTIPPGGKANFRVRLHVSRGGAQPIRSATVRTDCAQRPVLRFQLGCRIEE